MLSPLTAKQMEYIIPLERIRYAGLAVCKMLRELWQQLRFHCGGDVIAEEIFSFCFRNCLTLWSRSPLRWGPCVPGGETFVPPHLLLLSMEFLRSFDSIYGQRVFISKTIMQTRGPTVSNMPPKTSQSMMISITELVYGRVKVELCWLQYCVLLPAMPPPTSC